MGKHEKGSVKDIAKQIKSKGLQKLKFYCQLCEKQCRDANGFKCHLTSDSHLRQVKLFSGNAQGVMDRYSKEFEKLFLDNLRMRHQTVKVVANNVYQQVIQDKAHVHMNATIWASLSDFCKYLGKSGKCLVEETERGWMIQYIDRDPSKAAKTAELQQRAEAEQAAELALQEKFRRQREEAAKQLASEPLLQPSNLLDGTSGGRASNLNIHLELRPVKRAKTGRTAKKVSVFGDDKDGDSASEAEERPPSGPPLPPALLLETKKRPRSAEPAASRPVEKTSNDEKQDKNNDTWVHDNILVRIVDKKSAYFKQKAVVQKAGSRVSQVTLLDDSSTTLEIKQKHLETVVPKKTGTRVRILCGPHAGRTAMVQALNKDDFQASLQLSNDGTVVNGVDYNDFSQVA